MNSMKYFPLHVHSYFSLLDGLSSPEDIASRCVELGLEGSAITDHGSVSGAIQFLSAMKNVCKCGKQKQNHPNPTCDTFDAANKKPVLGCELNICNDDPKIKNARNKKLSHLCVIAKNDSGWRDLLEIVSMSNMEEYFYYKPRVNLDIVFEFARKGNLLAFSGHLGSNMAEVLYDENYDLRGNWKEAGINLAQSFRNAFGPNFFLEVQLMDSKHTPQQIEVAECIRAISRATDIPCVATPDAHYARKEDAIDHRVILCCNLKTNLNAARKPEFGMSCFFNSSQFHIPSYEEMLQWHTKEELDNTLLFASKIEEYHILKNPVLPKFECPNDMDADEYLRQLCKEGWSKKITGIVPLEKHAEYADRIKMELEVLQGAGLSSYFLIVADIINFVKSNGWLSGPGRGSAAGCLVSYLLGITSIDPIPYGLMFERFYNAGRNTEGRVSMPDIDIDVPKYAREQVIKYLRKKYGEDHVGQMVTFTTMKGRGAIKDVFRAVNKPDMTFEEINMITKNIIEEHKISDELQKMKQDTGEASIIKWCLENTPDKLSEWCRIDDDGNLSGPQADIFEQSIRLEGTKSYQSKHAAGIVISPEPLYQICPMVPDKETGRPMAGFEMGDLEGVGGLKVDILGITALDKAMGVSQDLKEGVIYEI